MSSLNLQIDPYASRDRRRERATTLFQALLAAHPDLDAKTAQSVFDSIDKTGELPSNLPTGKLQLKPAEGPSLPNQPPPQAEVPQNLGDLSFRPDKKKLNLIGFNQQNGQAQLMDFPQNVKDIIDSPDSENKVLPYKPKETESPKNGWTIYVDATSGKEIRRERSTRAGNQVVKVGASGRGQGGGGNSMTPQQRVWIEAVKKGISAHKDGFMTPELEKDFTEGAVGLGFDPQQVLENGIPPSSGFMGFGKSEGTPSTVRQTGTLRPKGSSAPSAGPKALGKKLAFNSEEEALKSGLPDGTEITVKGKRFKLRY
jgi:hypothetical protein